MQLETSGLIQKDKSNGRIISAKGQALLDSVAKEVADSIKQ